MDKVTSSDEVCNHMFTLRDVFIQSLLAGQEATSGTLVGMFVVFVTAVCLLEI
jgi:hypothetical protein